jgi:hypothetical protein
MSVLKKKKGYGEVRCGGGIYEEVVSAYEVVCGYCES